MKGGITLAIYIAIGITDAALGQAKAPSVFDYATAPVPISTNRPPSSDGWLPPDQRTPENVALQPKPPATASAQQSTHYKNVYKNVPGMHAWDPVDVPVGWQRTTITPPPAVTPERIVITYGGGGLVNEHTERFYGYRTAGNAVEIRGACYSACTLVAAHIGKDKLCFTADAFLAFHAVRSLKGEDLPLATGVFYRQLPPEIRSWIDRTGGWENLPLDGFWYLRAAELWGMGYPKCK